MLLNFKTSAVKCIFFLCLILLTASCETMHAAREEVERDRLITRHIKHALFKNDVVPQSGQHFGVAVRKGIVTLTGVADNPAQKQNAIAIAKRSQGVIAVESEITLEGDIKTLQTE